LLVATLIGPPVLWASPSSPDTIYDAQNLDLLTDSRNLTIMGLTAMAALFYLGAQVLELALIWRWPRWR
jgi:hypothetical protein